MTRIRFYRGIYRPHRTFRQLLASMSEQPKDYYFRIRNRSKADKTVLKFVYSPDVRKDRRCYSACKKVYQAYCSMCRRQHLKALSSWQFKKQMQLLGFVYKKHHRFYSGYHGNTVTTAFKNIAIKRQIHESKSI